MFNKFLGIIICIIVGNIVLTILESYCMNVWTARLIACLVVGICGVLIYRFEKK